MPSSGKKEIISIPKTSSSTRVIKIRARQILDSRGNPTLEAEVFLKKGIWGRGAVPSGASTGVHEALELRDKDETLFGGKSVLKAVENVNSIIGPMLLGSDASEQKQIDRAMIKLDGTPNKQKLGANSILSVSMAAARAAATARGVSLFRYLAPKKRYSLPVPMMNVLNGGKHAGNSLSIQEFLIEPIGARTFAEGLRFGTEVYQSLREVLKEKYGASAINVGDEGGYAPPLGQTREALDAVMSAVRKAGFNEHQIKLGLDAASSSFYEVSSKTYHIDGMVKSPGQLEDYYSDLVSTYPIISLEDPYDEEDYDSFSKITRRLGSKVKIIGDDLYVTNIKRLQVGIEKKATNAILIKLNQIGTVTETLEAISMAKKAGLSNIVSHRSGETEDTFISHLATATESLFIKTGAPARGERTVKYNELLRIEEELGQSALYSGSSLLG